MAINENVPYSSRAIVRKILGALILSIAFLASAVFITKNTFSHVNRKLDTLSERSGKLSALNAIYSDFVNLERQYQAPLFLNPYGSAKAYHVARDLFINRIDSIAVSKPFTVRETTMLDSIANMVLNQGALLMTYRALKRKEKPLFKQNPDSLIRLMSADVLLGDSSLVINERRYTTVPFRDTSSNKPTEQNKKGNFFQRLFFNRKDDGKKMEPYIPTVPNIPRTRITKDTTWLKHRDATMSNPEKIVNTLQRKHSAQAQLSQIAEISILQGSASIQAFLLALLRDAEEVEISELRNRSEEANGLMDKALFRMFLILGVFSVIATVLVLAILNDVAKSRFYRLQLIDEKERAERLGKVKERFLANMSHEIRTPLQNILGYSEKVKASDHLREEGEIIFSSSEHLLQIVNEVLDYSRISTGKLKLKEHSFELISLINEVVKSMQIQAGRKGIKLLHDCAIKHPTAYADPFRIRQILYNILGNAIKFTEKGFVQLKSSSRASSEFIELKLTVEDTGIGMKKSQIARLFIEFEQGDASMDAAGTGLGLSIAKELVTAYNGSILVESEPGLGSVFKINMRLGVPRSVSEKKQERSRWPRCSRVLVVDDDKTILNLIVQILEGKNITVSSTTSAVEGLAMLKTNSYDLLLVDFRMPVMTGGELCVKAKHLAPAMPVIAVTANVMQLEASSKMDVCFDGYLSKPFVAAELLHFLGYDENFSESENGSFALRKKLNSVTMGDDALNAEILAQFKKDCTQDSEDLTIAIERRDIDSLNHLSHRLAGRLAFFEITALARGFKGIEFEIGSGCSSETILDSAREMLAQLQDQLTKLD